MTTRSDNNYDGGVTIASWYTQLCQIQYSFLASAKVMTPASMFRACSTIVIPGHSLPFMRSSSNVRMIIWQLNIVIQLPQAYNFMCKVFLRRKPKGSILQQSSSSELTRYYSEHCGEPHNKPLQKSKKHNVFVVRYSIACWGLRNSLSYS